MSSSRRNIDILNKMIQYCDEIGEANDHFDNSLEMLKTNSTYKNAVAMCILQIGELTKHLSDDFRAAYTGMPWQDIKSMRNIAAHRYGDFRIEMLWDTVTDDIPALRKYCEDIIRQYEVIAQDCNEEIDCEYEEPEEEQGQSIKLE